MLVHITLVLAIILLVPMLCHKIHVPAIVGFLVAGMVVGPYGLGWLADTDAVAVMGKMGMLYLMFQSGSEIDLNEVQVQRMRVLQFGFYAFLFPLLIGLAVSYFVLDFDILTSALLGAMYGSHTLMTYPIVSRYGLQKSQSVNVVVGATMVSVTMALFLLAAVKNRVLGTDWLTVVYFSPLLFLIICGVFPRVTQVFFKRFTDPVADFMLVMLLLTLSAWMADYVGLDGILGAFLCGLSLNRLLPNRSSLMRRITFVGNSIFVPLFLLGVGMLIDGRVFLSGVLTWVLALTMILVKLCGKWLASFLAQKQWHWSGLERQLMFGLTSASAAGTLAVVSIGYETGVFGAEILNASVLMILVLCTVSSFVTEHAAKQLALQEEVRMAAEKEAECWQLLTTLSNEKSLRVLAESAQLQHVQTTVQATWDSIDNIVEKESCSVVVYDERQPLNTVSRLLVAVPRYAEKERDFITCFGLVRRLSAEIGARVVFYANRDTENVLRRMCQRQGKYLPASFREMDDWEDMLMLAKEIRSNDMLVLLSSRPSTASYNPLFAQIPSVLDKFFASYSTLVVYPEQQTGGADADTFLTDIPPASLSWRVVSRVKKAVLTVLGKLQNRS